MKRKIVFRGKNRYRKEWFYGYLEYNRVKEIARIHSYDNDGNYIGQNIVDPDTIGQFTGLLDKNGKEIYEGDIVRYYDDIEDELVPAEVIYHADSCSFCAQPKCSEPVGLFAHWQYEIIGNIFDNPSLISKKQ